MTGQSISHSAFSTSITSIDNRRSSLLAKKEEEEGKEEKSLPSEGASDILSSPAFLKRKLEVLKQDLAITEERLEAANTALEEGKAVWGDKFADLNKQRTNLQKRMSEQSNDVDESATVEVATKLLGVLENYNRAFTFTPAENDADKEVEEEYRKNYQGILDTLESLGVKEVECVGVEFDYEVHNAVMTRMSDEYDDGVVIEELAKGYVLGDMEEGGQLIRAAMVVVAA